MLTWSLLYSAFEISEWIIRVVMIVVLMRRRQINTVYPWMIIILFLPYPGLFLYLAIGNHRLPRRRIDRHAQLLDKSRRLITRFQNQAAFAPPELVVKDSGVAKLAEAVSHLPVRLGNAVELFHSSHDSIERLVEDIGNATHHVHLLFYIFMDDESGRQVAEALAGAAERGVKCRVLVDAVGSSKLHKTIGAYLIEHGVEFQYALPVHLLRRKLDRIDLRNHRKIAVIDGKIGYTGSQNIANEDYGRHDQVWHDMFARLEGPAVIDLQWVFLTDWFFETKTLLDAPELFPDPKIVGNTHVQVVPSGPSYNSEIYQRMVVTALYTAQKEVTITTPYFIPDEPFFQAMQAAALRGVTVNLLVPKRGDHFWVDMAGKAYYEYLLEQNIHIYEFHLGILHTKSMMIDDAYTFFGSSNFDIRSFSLNYEINLVFYSDRVTRRLGEICQWYLVNSTELTLKQVQERPFYKRIIQQIAKLLSPLL